VLCLKNIGTQKMSNDLQRKLRRLGVVKGAEGLEKSVKLPQPDLPDALLSLPGKEVRTAYGSFWLDQRIYTQEHEHGLYTLGTLQSIVQNDMSVFGVNSLGSTPAFIDTETTGLAGGAGTIAFLIGIGVWEQPAFTLHLVFVRNPDEEEPALRYVAEVLNKCTGLVTFNGRTFDLPIIESRFILNRLIPEWYDKPHLDLLAVARQLWRDHLPSRRLGELEEKILGIVRTDEDIPSYLIPYYYRQYLETGQTAEMRQVMYHNEVDILSLVTLLVHVINMVSAPEEMELAATEWAGLGNVLFTAGSKKEAITAWEKALSHLPDNLPADTASRLCNKVGLYYKRRISWDKALQIWDTWVENVPDAVNPLVEKAKYYEWTASSVEQALTMTESAIHRVLEHYEETAGERLMQDLLHRKERLLLKLKTNSELLEE
jgi:uncharacterized protein YprB with RNaseH-like and TPR domain